MKEQLISVIIPVYNVALYLDECLKTVCGQTYHNIEIILIDDGSTDGSAQICDEWKKRDSRILVVHKDNEGASVARNVGLQMAKGDYISFVDADDWIEKSMYEEMYKRAKIYDADIVISEKAEDRKKEDNIVFSGVEASKEIMTGKRPLLVHTWNKLFCRELIQNIRFAPEIIIGEDLLFVAEAVLNAKKCIWINERLYHYRERTGSAMRSSWSLKKTMSDIEVRYRRTELYKNNEMLKNASRKELLKHILVQYFLCSMREYSEKEEKEKDLLLLKQEARKIPMETADGVNINIGHMLLRLNGPIYVWASKMYLYMRTKRKLFKSII